MFCKPHRAHPCQGQSKQNTMWRLLHKETNYFVNGMLCFKVLPVWLLMLFTKGKKRKVVSSILLQRKWTDIENRTRILGVSVQCILTGCLYSNMLPVWQITSYNLYYTISVSHRHINCGKIMSCYKYDYSDLL